MDARLKFHIRQSSIMIIFYCMLLHHTLIISVESCSGSPRRLQLGDRDYCKDFRCYRGEGDCDCDEECAPNFRFTSLHLDSKYEPFFRCGFNNCLELFTHMYGYNQNESFNVSGSEIFFVPFLDILIF